MSTTGNFVNVKITLSVLYVFSLFLFKTVFLITSVLEFFLFVQFIYFSKIIAFKNIPGSFEYEVNHMLVII